MSENKKNDTTGLFNNISLSYDYVNRLITFRMDKYWRRKTIAKLKPYAPKKILDIATGTGDLAIAASLLHPDEIIGIDLAENMLLQAQKKAKKKNLQDIISFKTADAEAIPFPDDYFDAVTIAFGLRNFSNPHHVLSEIKRVLKHGGIVSILETSRPRNFPVKPLYTFYFQRVIPLLGKIITKNREAYRYFSDTVLSFPQGEELLKKIQESGLLKTQYLTHTWGTVTIYTAIK